MILEILFVFSIHTGKLCCTIVVGNIIRKSGDDRICNALALTFYFFEKFLFPLVSECDKTREVRSIC